MVLENGTLMNQLLHCIQASITMYTVSPFGMIIFALMNSEAISLFFEATRPTCSVIPLVSDS